MHGVGILRVPSGTQWYSAHSALWRGISQDALAFHRAQLALPDLSTNSESFGPPSAKHSLPRRASAACTAHPSSANNWVRLYMAAHEQQWYLKIRYWRGSRAMEAPSTHCVLDGSLNDIIPSQPEHSKRDTVLEACNVVSTL